MASESRATIASKAAVLRATVATVATAFRIEADILATEGASERLVVSSHQLSMTAKRFVDLTKATEASKLLSHLSMATVASELIFITAEASERFYNFTTTVNRLSMAIKVSPRFCQLTIATRASKLFG